MRVAAKRTPANGGEDRAGHGRRMIAVLAVMFALLPGAGEARAQRGAFDHSALDTLLAGNVHDGRVDYERIAATRLAPLDAYLGRLAAAEPDSLTGDEQLAF